MTPSTPIFSTFCWAWARPANPPPVRAATASPTASHPAALCNVVIGPSRRPAFERDGALSLRVPAPCRYDSVVYNAIGFCVHNLPMARNATIDHVVYDGIHRAILEQRLPPGTKLGEESLSSLFDVSRARVRRILLRLAHDKSVKLRPNRGAHFAQSCCACDEHRALLAELEIG